MEGKQKKKQPKRISTVEKGRTALLASILDSSDDAIISKTLEGVVMSWNRAAESLYGYTAEEMIGKPISVLLPPGRPREMDETLAQIRKGERVDHYETLRRRKDGGLIHVSLTVSHGYQEHHHI